MLEGQVEELEIMNENFEEKNRKSGYDRYDSLISELFEVQN